MKDKQLKYLKAEQFTQAVPTDHETIGEAYQVDNTEDVIVFVYDIYGDDRKMFRDVIKLNEAQSRRVLYPKSESVR